jgi:hypothetical protein
MKKQQIGRLSLRVEGNNWNAYYAMPDTMEGALWLGSIAMAFVRDHPVRKQAFMDIMRDAVGDIIEQETGVRPTWGGEQGAPEHERAGTG